jgi:signal peptidase I
MNSRSAAARHLPPAMTVMAGLSGPDTGASGAPPAPETPVSRSPVRQGRRIRRSLTGLALALLVLVVASVVGLLPVQIMRVGSDSMSPTIAAGDLVLLDRGNGAVERMDVVVVDRPDTDVLLVKRAVALEGDEVSIEDGVLVVNGADVCEPTIDPARLDGVWFGPVTVPQGRLFLLGDDRDSSIDSRAFGTVSADDVTGVVSNRLWPSPGALPAEDHC